MAITATSATPSAAAMAAMSGMAMNNTSPVDNHLEPMAPPSGDPRFIEGSTGAFGQSKKIVQADGPAYGGQPVEKNQNANDKKQQNYGVTDANFTHTLGVIADPDTGQPMSYAQTMQAYNAVGAIQSLAPDIYAQLVKNQDAGLGTVQGGALAIMGITQTDGQGGKSLTGIDQAAMAKMASAQLPGLGSVKDMVLSTTDFKGRAWNRAHHSLSSWNSMTDLANKGWSWPDAALFTGDSMTSWAGRVSGTNNQNGDPTGFAADELAGLKYLTLVEQATGKPDILESVLMSHAATHLPDDQLTNPKINKFLGLPEGFRPKTTADIKMYAARLRQWAAQPGVQVDQGEFEKFVKKTPADIAGVLNASGLLNTVQFKPEQPHTHTAAAATNTAAEAPIMPTPVGTGTLTQTGSGSGTVAGGGTTATPAATGAPSALPATTPLPAATPADTATAIDQLNASPAMAGAADNTLAAPIARQHTVTHLASALLGQVDKVAKTGTLSDADKALLYALLMDVADQSSASVLDTADRKDKTKVAAALRARTKAQNGAQAVEAALADGKIDATERAALGKLLDPATVKLLQSATKDGKITAAELAKIKDSATAAAAGADMKGLPEAVRTALADGKLSAAERATLAKTLSPHDLAAFDAATKGGKLDKTALAKLGASIAEKSATDPKAATSTAAQDAQAGAATVDANGKPVAATKATAATADAKAAATAVTHPGVIGSSAAAPPGGNRPGSQPATGTKPVASTKAAA